MLLYPAALARAYTIDDLGIVSGSFLASGALQGIFGSPGPGTGTYTVDALQFIGPNLGVVINGQTVADILAEDLVENDGNFAFNFPGPFGAAGTAANLSSVVSVDGSGVVHMSPGTWVMTSCGGWCGNGTAVGDQLQNFDPLDPAGIFASMFNAGIFPSPWPGVSGFPASSTSSATLNLGCNVGTNPPSSTTCYEGETRDTAYQVKAVYFGAPTPVPEPSTMLLLGSGLIVLIGRGRKKVFYRATQQS